MYRNRLNADDEAKFALLEPDGVSPMKARARQSVAAGGLRGAPEEVRSRAAGAPKRP